MRDENTRKVAQKGRRNFLKSLGAVGISGTALNYLSKDSLTDLTGNLKDEVPIVKKMSVEDPKVVDKDRTKTGRGPVYKTIDYDQWIYTKSRSNAAEKVRKHLEDKTSMKNLRVGVKSKISGQQRKSVVNVEYNKKIREDGSIDTPEVSVDELKGILPHEVSAEVGDGPFAEKRDRIEVEISTKTRNIEEKQTDVEDVATSSSWYYNENYRPVPAGCEMMTASTIHKNSGKGTLGTPAYDHSKNKHVLVTASHILFYSSGKEVHQPKDPWWGDNIIGHSDKVHCDDYCNIDGYIPGDEPGDSQFDAGTIDPNKEIKYDFAKDGGGYEGWGIDGTLSWDILQVYRDSGGSVSFRGMKSGHHWNAEVIETFTGRENEKAFRVSESSTGGDSGGPAFQAGNYTSIAGILMGGGDGETYFTAMEAIEDRFNLEINPSL